MSSFLPQSGLAQALHMQLLHSLVAERLLVENDKGDVGLVLEELGELGPCLVGAVKLGEGCGNVFAGDIRLRSKHQRAPANANGLLAAARHVKCEQETAVGGGRRLLAVERV